MKLKPYPKYKDSGVPWLGDVPEHWEVKKLKAVAKVKASGVDKHSNENEIPVRLCNYTDVYKNDRITNAIKFMQATATEEEIRNFQLIAGDVVITKDSENWDDIAVPSYIPNDLPNVICAYHLSLIRPFYRSYGAYLSLAFQVQPFSIQFKVSANGVTRFGLPQHAIKNSFFFVPTHEEQQQIARYLDWKTAQINKFIRNKRRLIQLLKEQKQNIINEAVTKGINPNVEMKDSGVEWLGQIPKHWEVRRIKSLSQVKRGASPRPIVADKYFDQNGEYAWVRISDVSANGKYLEYTTQQLSELGKSKSVPLQPESIFLSIAGSVGKPTITKIKCCIHDGFVYFPDYKYNVEYLYYVFLSGNLWNGLGKLGTQLNLNTGTVGAVSIGLPPNSEQQEIVTYIEKETALIDKTISRTEREIELIQEYRSRLVSDVVTGKLDVRGIEIPDFEPVEADLELEEDDESEGEEIDEDE